MSQRLGDLLVKEKIITPEQLGGRHQFSLAPVWRPRHQSFLFRNRPAVVKLIPFETAKRYQILPLSRVGSSLTIAMVDPTNVFAMDDIKFMTGFNIEPVVASEARFSRAIKKLTARPRKKTWRPSMQSMSEPERELELQAEESKWSLAELEKAAEEAPVVKLVNWC
jgi:type IV pilus assembly protein PilB